MCKKLVLLTSVALVVSLAGANMTLGAIVWEGRINNGNDDVEEYVSDGRMYMTSSDLEITEEGDPGSNQVIGLRFNNVLVPQGANVASAYVQFHVDEVDVPGDNRPGTKFLRGEAADNAAPFTTAPYNVSSRPTTSAEASWDWPEWLTVHEEGPDQRTSDISAVIKEIVDRPGWSPGNSLVLIITGSGENAAESFNGEPDSAALLHIEYTTKYASNPVPPDGALVEDTWVSLSWEAGETAASHDVYLSDNPDDVTNGTGDAFRGNQTATFYVAGFPGFAYPDGLIPGTTYSWRIDEVEADGVTKYMGSIWSFSIPSKTAYNPNPADGAKFIDPDLSTLSWTAGFGAKLHTVYFGDDFDTVDNATGGLPQGATTYTIPGGPLVPEKTYYWRVDEFDAIETHKGDVWSFTIAGEGGGLRAQYYHWTGEFPPPNPFQSFVVSEVVPEINWNWGNSSPHTLVNEDDFAIKFTGEIEAVFTETYTFHVTTDDGQRLWVNDQLIINAWVQQGMTEWSGSIDLVAGQKYPIELWMYEHGGGAGCEMRWSSPRTSKQIVPQAALSLPVRARKPNPTNGATGTSLTPILRWNPGDFAAEHDVYFGTDADAVTNATKASPEFKATKALGDERYDPGKLVLNTTYYWRVDEVNNLNADSPWVGQLWSFTTGDFLVVDDFENYTDDDAAGEAIWQAWVDGFGVPDNGAQVGYLLPPYAEQWIVNNGLQSMPLLYINETGVTNSEASLALSSTRDWTEEGVGVLSLWFRGESANAAEPLYVAVSNASGAPALVTHTDPAAATLTTWTEWRTPLQTFVDQGITLTNVDKIAIGLGSKGGVAVGGSGTMYIDDIRLNRP